jgi:tetratricopeptide (TPR) repeat protein
LNQQIDRLEEIYKSEMDPQGRAFVPLADAHRRLGDLGKALAVLEEGLGTHPDFASAHMVAGWVHRSRKATDDAMRSFERVLVLDAENMLAKAAIAELIDDQRAQSYRDKMAAKESAEAGAEVTAEAEGRVVPISSLAPGAPDEDSRPVVSIASLAPGTPPEDARPVVSIASLAPGTPVEDARSVVSIASLAPDDDGLRVVPIPTLAPDEVDYASDEPVVAGGEIYTETLAELYAGQGATDKAIEVYRKLIEYDPDNEALTKRLTELEMFEPGSERQTVPIESLAPDGTSG